MMKRISPKIWIPVVAVVFLIAVGIVLFLAWPKGEEAPEIISPEVTSEKTTPEIPADWKTYRNEEHGFELEYPFGREWPGEPRLGPLDDPNILYFGPDGPFDEMITLTINEIPGEEDRQWLPFPREEAEAWRKTELTIDGRLAVRYESEGEVEEVRGVSGPFRYKEVIVVVESKNRRYIFSLNRNIENQRAFAVFDQIVASFKIID